LFTGIIEEKGVVRRISPHGIEISCGVVLEETKIGDSIAVNGVCLTVNSMTSNTFCADIMNETLRRTNLGKLRSGSQVNLERAMPSNGRFGGHIVSGHIDGTGTVSDIKRDANAIWYNVETERNLLKYVIEKGSVAVDGISLTVANINNSGFAVSIIPLTASETTLSERKVGDTVNIETDVIGKYVGRMLSFTEDTRQTGIGKDFLAKYGYLGG